jgi:hypothetical protein
MNAHAFRLIKLILATATVILLAYCTYRMALWIGPWSSTTEVGSFGLGALVQADATALVIGITEYFKYIRGEPPTREIEDKAEGATK